MEFIVEIIAMDVHKWGKDGQGEYVCSKEGYQLGSYKTLKQAKENLEDYFRVNNSDLFVIGDGFYSANLIEDESGYESKTGNYIVDYSIIINKVTTERIIEI
tara:strand:+ start:300 stop:605 length:306 start_codon:yes stop_codon:yes gene_type:complete